MELNNMLAIQMESINLETLLKIQKDIDFCDAISIAFLLCGSTRREFEHLILNRLTLNICETSILFQWGVKTQARWTWKWELLDALFTCQLFSTIKQLGFQLPSVKLFFATTTVNYVHPMRKVIYKICETMSKTTFSKIVNILATNYNITLSERNQDVYELMFLQLMNIDFFTIPGNGQDAHTERMVNVKKIVSVLEQFPELRDLCTELKSLAFYYDSNQMKSLSVYNKALESPMSATQEIKESATGSEQEDKDRQILVDDLQETFTLLNQLSLEDSVDLKTDICN